MTIEKCLGLAACAVFFGAIISATAAPSRAEHCYNVSDGILYCYNTAPAGETHTAWFSDEAPPLQPGRSWDCNYHAHPRTICISLGPSNEGPVYTPLDQLIFGNVPDATPGS